MRSPIIWEHLFMEMAVSVSKRSKDPKTQVGCILVSPDNRQIHMGYNGFPRGIEENLHRWTRPYKYDFVIHAEENAILNAKCELENWSCYVTVRPCEKCAGKIVQKGIKKIYFLEETESADYSLSNIILKEGGAEIIRIPNTYGYTRES